MTVFQKQGAIASRHAANCVTGGIIVQIGLCFDDSVAGHDAVNLANRYFAKQSTGRRLRVRGDISA
jgi:hypothetical protein